MARSGLVMLAAETGAELTRSWRAPEFLLPTIGLPLAFYLLFGVLFARTAAASTQLLATYGVFAVMGPALFGFGVGVAADRERGWLELKRAAPASGAIFVGARLAATLAFSAVALLSVHAAAALLGDVALPRPTWAVLFAVQLGAVVPLSLVGLAIGFSFGSNGAVAIGNVVFLAFAVLGGLWFPAALFPDWMIGLARALPSYHLAELALALVDETRDRAHAVHLAAVAAMTLFFAALASWAWMRQR